LQGAGRSLDVLAEALAVEDQQPGDAKFAVAHAGARDDAGHRVGRQVRRKLAAVEDLGERRGGRGSLRLFVGNHGPGWGKRAQCRQPSDITKCKKTYRHHPPRCL